MPAAAAPPKFDFNARNLKLKDESFFQFIAEYPNWESATVYLYRLWPVIDRSLAGHKMKNIDVYPRPLTQEDILRSHGSGKYELQFNDSNRPRGQVNVARCILSLENPDYPPAPSVDELVLEHPDNRSYVEGLKRAGTLREPAPAGQGDATAATLAHSLADVTRTILNRPASATPPPKDPFEIAQKMMEAQNAAGNGMLGMLMQWMGSQREELAELRRQNGELMLKLVEGQKRDPLADVSMVLELAEKLGNLKGDTGWLGVVDKIADKLPGAVTALTGSMRQAAAPPPTPNPEETPMPQQQPQAAATPDELFEMLRPALAKAANSGSNGTQFASFVEVQYGNAVYEALYALGESGLLEVAKRNQQFWAHAAPYEDFVKAFIHDFIDYGTPEPEGPVQ